MTGEILYKFKTPTGITGNVMSYKHDGRAIYSEYFQELVVFQR